MNPRAWPSERSGEIASLVCGCRLGPQVELSPIGLHLAPDRCHADQDHGQHDQLLRHGNFPTSSVTNALATRNVQTPEFTTDPYPQAIDHDSLASPLSSLAIHALGIPDRLGCLINLARFAEYHE